MTTHEEIDRGWGDESGPLFLGDWDRVLFVHYEVSAHALQPCCPYELDTYEGVAYVSLVAFTLRDMRLAKLAPWGNWLTAPIATHNFLNVRTYVRHRGDVGIYFLREWIPNRISLLLGPIIYGLPYRYAESCYKHPNQGGALEGNVTRRGLGQFRYRGEVGYEETCESADTESITYWLTERYLAFTKNREQRFRFKVWHRPWVLHPVDLTVEDDSLLENTEPYWGEVHFSSAYFCPRLDRVEMGRPVRIS